MLSISQQFLLTLSAQSIFIPQMPLLEIHMSVVFILPKDLLIRNPSINENENNQSEVDKLAVGLL